MYKLSHIQVKVKNIKQAIDDYGNLGFTVERGGQNSRNAFIWFKEGAFIELLEMHKTDKPFGFIFGLIYGKAMKKRWDKWCIDKEGMIDFAMEPSDKKRKDINYFSVIRNELKELNLNPSKIISWKRKNIRQETIRFSYITILPKDLPFMVSEYDIPQKPREVYHENGAESICSIDVRCKKEDYKYFNSITKYDNSIRLNIGDKFEILNIEIKGLKENLLKDLLHKAIIKAK